MEVLVEFIRLNAWMEEDGPDVHRYGGVLPTEGDHNEKAQLARKQDIGILGGRCVGICLGAPCHNCLDELPCLTEPLSHPET